MGRMGAPKHAKKCSPNGKSTFKKITKGVAVLVITGALVSYPLNLPHIKAYFTDNVTSEVIKLFFKVHRFNNLGASFEVNNPGDDLVATVRLPKGCGFDADNVISASLEMVYKGSGALLIAPSQVESWGKSLKLTFDWATIEELIDSDDYSPGFIITGKGAGSGQSGRGERFTFRAEGTAGLPSPKGPESILLIEIPQPEDLKDGDDSSQPAETEGQGNKAIDDGDGAAPAPGNSDQNTGGPGEPGSEETGRDDTGDDNQGQNNGATIPDGVPTGDERTGEGKPDGQDNNNSREPCPPTADGQKEGHGEGEGDPR